MMSISTGGIGFIFVGGLLGLIGAFLFIRTILFISKARQVQGTVIRMVYTSGEGGGYSPVFQFRTLEGQLIEKEEDIASNLPRFKEGQVIKVLYDPGNPQNARIKKGMSLYGASAILFILGLVFGGYWGGDGVFLGISGRNKPNVSTLIMRPFSLLLIIAFFCFLITACNGLQQQPTTSVAEENLEATMTETLIPATLTLTSSLTHTPTFTPSPTHTGVNSGYM